jgi:putative CocE/NonD family hydrolase
MIRWPTPIQSIRRPLAAACFVLLLAACVGSPPPTTLAPTETPGRVAAVTPSPTAVSTATPEERVSRPGVYQGYSHELYPNRGWVKISQYITVRDGTKLAIDIYRPAEFGHPVSTPLPVIWTHTRYHRERSLPPWLSRMLMYGYVVAAADVRGAGASFGTWQGNFSPEETQDAYDITEWLAAQPWSNGNIGMYGGSYLGMTQYMAASTAPPHLKAIVPEKSGFDAYSFAYAGGVFYNDFFAQWTAYVKELDTSGAPVDQDTDRSQLAAALQMHQANRSLLQVLAVMPYRDSRDVQTNEQLYQTRSPSSHLNAIRNSRVAIYHWGGWYDLFTRDTLLWFKNLSNPQKVIVGPWAHAQTWSISDIEHLRWYDYWLKGINNGIMQEPPIYYYTMGEGAAVGWHSAWQWPLPNQQPTSFYFSGEPAGSLKSTNGGSLSRTPPANASGKDNYVVDYSTTTGNTSRWDSGTGTGYFAYPGLIRNDEKGLTYTTPPLAAPVEVTGHPIVHLWVTSTAKDGDFFIYLEDVKENGYSSYVTEGTLRASHRALAAAPYDNFGLPYHRSFAEDFAELPGDPTELVLDLQPTSYMFDVGHRIRVTITGADKDNALTPAQSPPPTVSVYRDADHASRIVLPIIPSR